MKPAFLFIELHRWSSIVRKTALLLFVFFAATFVSQASVSDTSAAARDSYGHSEIMYYIIFGVGLVALMSIALYITSKKDAGKTEVHKHPKIKNSSYRR